MATKDESPGLLSKVVKFVKNPTTNWADLDSQDADRESQYSKQMLKEMIERKRRNDFVRKREFDMLRKMRRSEVIVGDPMARPSFFQSSMPSKPDDRATTLKKIDEIEAQMSMQWWKTKHADASVRPSAPGAFQVSSITADSSRPPLSVPAPPPAGPALRSNAYIATEPQPLERVRPPAPAEPEPLMPDFQVPKAAPVRPSPSILSRAAPAPAPIATRAAPVPATAPPMTAARPPATAARAPAAATPAPAQRPAAVPPRPNPMLSQTSAGGPNSEPFTASKFSAIDVGEFEHDPDLEEASIRFANGDDAGAEAVLLELLAPKGPRIDHGETWLTLFDLYRATGRQDRFETAAIDFAGRFGRSAPQWFSIPEAVGRMSTPATASGPQGAANWTAPASVGTQTIAAMSAALARAPQPWKLSWAKLNSIDEAAIEPLTRQFTQWAAQPLQLRFVGADKLEKVLKEATPSGDKGVNPAWWKLRMEVLRAMHRPDEFELVALDYCVTYEVSPPSWESARCEYKPILADGSYVAGHTIVGEAFRDSVTSGLSSAYGDSSMLPLSQASSTNISTVELAGQILADASEALDMLEAKTLGADVIVISCARLIRIDFSAAGTLLNWVTARQVEGRQVQFVDGHRLVAAFFNVIGISEHSRVVARAD